MAKSIMIQGTMSNAGKSVLAGGLLRVLKQDGIRAVPFKSQNMALNSYITKDGLEMGRAQVMQAEAAGVEPDVMMNPILLKPTNDVGSQVIVNGEVVGVMGAAEYYRRKTEYVPDIMKAYQTLSEQNDVIVIEGAGSPAEINLKTNDIVNMGLAELVDAPVLLAGDIDRGGVFAQIVGTIALLEQREKERVKGVIINKFRGDKEILRPGLDMLEERTGIPVCGVVPYFYLDIDDEDSLSERFQKKDTVGLVDIAVIRLPRISNFTDFAALEYIPEVSLRYVQSAAELGNPDAIILPGTKNTISDLLWMRQNGLEAKILQHAKQKKLIFGICGGYQMLGNKIYDPEGVEQKGEIRGMGLLPTVTHFEQEKSRTRVTGSFHGIKGMLKNLNGCIIEGYEIHMGRTEVCEGQEQILSIKREDSARRSEENLSDGAQCDHVYGCYIHGVFDYPGIAKEVVCALCREKGLEYTDVKAIDLKKYKDTQYDLLAEIIRDNLDMKRIYEIIEKGNRA